jgi:hypothetical protein
MLLQQLHGRVPERAEGQDDEVDQRLPRAVARRVADEEAVDSVVQLGRVGDDES